MTRDLERAEALLRARGPARIPDGLAERAARAALAAEPAESSGFLAQLLPVAWRTAVVSVAAAIALAVVAGHDPGDESAALSLVNDPLTGEPVHGLTMLPDELADPTLGLLGGTPVVEGDSGSAAQGAGEGQR